MTKTFTTAKLREIGGTLFSSWEENKNEIKLSGKALYDLISLKKMLENKLIVVEETLSALASQFGAVPQENGSLIIPEDRREEAGEALVEFGDQVIELDFKPIVLNEDSHMPIMIFEVLFDFITFED